MILYTIFLSLAVLTTAEDGKSKEKRGIVDYNISQPPSSKYSQVYLGRPYKSYQQAPVDTATAYTKSAQSILQKSGPVLAPQEYQQYYQPQQQQQQHQQVESQALAYQSAGTKFSPFASGLDKYNFNSKPQYSSASEVSSFSYSSPVVSYTNKGLLKQIIGKGAPQDTPITYSSPSPKKQYQSPKYQYISVPSTQHSSQQSAYSSAAGLQSADAYSSSPNQYSSSNSLAYSSPSAYTQPSSTYTQPSSGYTQSSAGYSQSPNAYSQSASSYPSQQLGYDDASSAYQQLSQKGLFTASEQQPQQQQVYQPSPTVGQKYNYVQAPAPAAYQVQKSPQVNYASQGQDYSHAPQASASSNYETTDQQQLFYAQPNADQQYYNVGSHQPKYTKSNGVTYA